MSDADGHDAVPGVGAHPIEALPLVERAGAYESELEKLRGALESTDTELDFGA